MVIFPILMCSVVALSMAEPVPYALAGDSEDVTSNNAEANPSDGQASTVGTDGVQESSAGLIAEASPQTSDQGTGEGDSGKNSFTGQQASQGSSNETQSGSNGKDSYGGQQTTNTTTQTYPDNTGGSSGGLNNRNGSSSGCSGQSNSYGRGSGYSYQGTPAFLNHIVVSLGQGGSGSNGGCIRDGQNQGYAVRSADDQQSESTPFALFY